MPPASSMNREQTEDATMALQQLAGAPQGQLQAVAQPPAEQQQQQAISRGFTLMDFLHMAGFNTEGFEEVLSRYQPRAGSTLVQEPVAAARRTNPGTAPQHNLLPSPSGKLHGSSILSTDRAVAEPSQLPQAPAMRKAQPMPALIAAPAAAPPTACPRGIYYPFGPPRGVSQQQHHGVPPLGPQLDMQENVLASLLRAVDTVDAVDTMQQPAVKRNRGRPRKQSPEAAANMGMLQHTSQGDDALLEALLRNSDISTETLPQELLEQQQLILESCRPFPRSRSSGDRRPPKKQSRPAAAAADDGDDSRASKQMLAAAAAAEPAAIGSSTSHGAVGCWTGSAVLGSGGICTQVPVKKPRRSYGWYLLQQAQEQEQAPEAATGTMQTDQEPVQQANPELMQSEQLKHSEDMGFLHQMHHMPSADGQQQQQQQQQHDSSTSVMPAPAGTSADQPQGLTTNLDGASGMVSPAAVPQAAAADLQATLLQPNPREFAPVLDSTEAPC